MHSLAEVLLLESIGKGQLLVVGFLPVWHLDSRNGWLLENDVLTRIISPLARLWSPKRFFWFAFPFLVWGVWGTHCVWRCYLTLWARHLNEVFNIGVILCLGEDIHPLSVEFLHAPSEVKDVEGVTDTNSEPLSWEIEPISVSFSVWVNFQDQVVLFTIVDVSWVKVAAFKVLVKSKNVLLVDELR
jgi:hypothetical protein